MEDDLFAEVLVVLFFTAGDRHAAELHAGRGRLDRDLVAIEVVVVGDVPAQLHAVARGAVRREHEGLVGEQEIRIGLGAAAEQRAQVEAAALLGCNCGRRGRRSGVARCRRSGHFRGYPGALRPRDPDRPILRRIAEARIGAALQLHTQVKVLRCAAERDGDPGIRDVAVDDLLAEVLVLVVESDGQARRAERDARRGRFEPETIPIEVVPRCDLETHDELARLGRRRHLVRRAHREEIFVGGHARTCGGKERQQQRQQAQAPADRQGGDQWHGRVSPSGGVDANANDTWTGPVGRCSRPLRESAQESIAIVWPGRRAATVAALKTIFDNKNNRLG